MEKTILVIEDDLFLQGLEVMKLKKEGYNVIPASNSVEAYRAMDTKKPISLMLLDLMLPEIDGFTILEKIRKDETYKDTPIIVFSNLYEEKDVSRANKLGISQFMIKSNFTLDELIDKVKKLIK